MMEAATWVGSIAGCVVAVTAVVALLLAWRQLTNLGSTLRIGRLNTILDIETQMNSRKERVDEQVEKIQRSGGLTDEQKKVEQDALDVRLENWFNAVDRLAFCILKDFVPEKDCASNTATTSTTLWLSMASSFRQVHTTVTSST